MIELGVTTKEFINLLSGSNNKTCPESDFHLFRIWDYNKIFKNGFSLYDKKNHAFVPIDCYDGEKKSNDDCVSRILSQYELVIAIKLIPCGSERVFVEYLPYSKYYEYICCPLEHDEEQEKLRMLLQK